MSQNTFSIHVVCFTFIFICVEFDLIGWNAMCEMRVEKLGVIYFLDHSNVDHLLRLYLKSKRMFFYCRNRRQMRNRPQPIMRFVDRFFFLFFVCQPIKMCIWIKMPAWFASLTFVRCVYLFLYCWLFFCCCASTKSIRKASQ